MYPASSSSYTPPMPPPKPGVDDTSRISTPTTTDSPRPPPPRPDSSSLPEAMSSAQAHIPRPQPIPDPGESWLPRYLEDKSKQDLTTILSKPELLAALVHSESTIHPSLSVSHSALAAALTSNLELSSHLADASARLSHQRASTQAALLSTHALERQWRSKQRDMDEALAPFAPASLYQRAAAGVGEAGQVAEAVGESFLEGEGGEGEVVGEREAGEWIRRYREARKGFYLRKERKERWDEGRVGGWR